MDRITLGRTGLQVSVAGLGCGGRSRLGLGQGGTTEQAAAVVRAALDLGITVIDTAAIYATEEAVGAGVKGRRDEVTIATKIKVTEVERGNADGPLIDAAELRRRVERSLSRLATDRIDILYLHGVKPHEFRHCADVLQPELRALRTAGKIRFTGMSEWFDSDLQHAALMQAVRAGGFDVIMCGLNMVNQSALGELLPAARDKGVGVFCMYAVRGTLARPDDARSLVRQLVESGEVDRADIDPDDPLGFVLRESGARTLSEAAYRFCRYATGVDVVLTGTGNILHLADNVRSIQGGPLPPATVTRLQRVFGRVMSAAAAAAPLG